MQDIKNLTLRELAQALKDWGYPSFHAAQIFCWIYQRGAMNFQEMSDLALDLRVELKGKFSISGLKLKQTIESFDGTEKFLFSLDDGNLIEAVSIPAKDRVTGCVSTQAGCKFACSFCASGLLGFKRNLTTAEILEQILYLKYHSKQKSLTHLVFMGIGEPLDNYEPVLKAIRIINAKESLNIGARKITISTCGLIPGIKRLQEEGLQIELSVSLHASDNKTRDKLMPVNKKYPLKDLLNACRQYFKKTNRQVTFEYILIKGVNADLKSAANLCIILKGMNCKVNLIPLNTVKEYESGISLQGLDKFAIPNKMEILIFKDYLLKHGINSTLRKPRGQDIAAACGQLRLNYAK